MGIFIRKDDKVPVSIDQGVNVVWVRRKMDLGTSNRVQDALMSANTFDERGAATSLSFNVGRMNTILMQNNILAWEGPKFREDGPDGKEGAGPPIPCTSQAIESLDPDDPLVDAVLKEINARNAKKKPELGEDGKPLSPLSSTTALSANGNTHSAQRASAKR